MSKGPVYVDGWMVAQQFIMLLGEAMLCAESTWKLICDEEVYTTKLQKSMENSILNIFRYHYW